MDCFHFVTHSSLYHEELHEFLVASSCCTTMHSNVSQARSTSECCKCCQFTVSQWLTVRLSIIPRSAIPYQLNSHRSVKPGERQMPPRIPYDIEYDDDNCLRITSYTSPHISADSLLPCMMDMTTKAFNAVWKQKDPHPAIDNNQYVCLKNNFELIIKSHQPTAPIEYPDLILVANMILYFQQTFIMPGINFDYYFKGSQIGQGSAKVQKTTNTAQTVAQS